MAVPRKIRDCPSLIVTVLSGDVMSAFGDALPLWLMTVTVRVFVFVSPSLSVARKTTLYCPGLGKAIGPASCSADSAAPPPKVQRYVIGGSPPDTAPLKSMDCPAVIVTF